MGLTALHLEVLVDEAKQRPFSGRVVTCGVLDSNITFSSLYRRAAEEGVTLRKIHPRLSPNPSQFPAGCLHSASVLEMLGFDEVVAMDASDFEGAEITLDLNQEDTPKDLVGTADLVLEAGTLEHLVRIVKTGGRILHTSPASNFIDHGFYSFSPTFFFDFYRQNGFRLETLEVWRYGENADLAYRLPYMDPAGQPVRYAEIAGDKTRWRPVVLGTSGSRQPADVHGVVCVATKMQDTSPVVPQQHEYSAGQWSSQQPSFHLAVSKAMEFARRRDPRALRQHLEWMKRLFPAEQGSWLSAFQAGQKAMWDDADTVRFTIGMFTVPLVVRATSLHESRHQKNLEDFLDHLPRLPGALDECLRWASGFSFREGNFGSGDRRKRGKGGFAWGWILAGLCLVGTLFFLLKHRH